METWVRVGGDWKRVTEAWVRSGGNWQKLMAAWVGSGGVWRQCYNSSLILTGQTGDVLDWYASSGQIWRIHQFWNSGGTYTMTVTSSGILDNVVLLGGGGGGGYQGGGGGGGGGISILGNPATIDNNVNNPLYSSSHQALRPSLGQLLKGTTIQVTVGAGGALGTSTMVRGGAGGTTTLRIDEGWRDVYRRVGGGGGGGARGTNNAGGDGVTPATPIAGGCGGGGGGWDVTTTINPGGKGVKPSKDGGSGHAYAGGGGGGFLNAGNNAGAVARWGGNGGWGSEFWRRSPGNIYHLESNFAVGGGGGGGDTQRGWGTYGGGDGGQGTTSASVPLPNCGAGGGGGAHASGARNGTAGSNGRVLFMYKIRG